MSECYGEWSGDEEQEDTIFEIKTHNLKKILSDLLKKYPEKKEQIQMIFNEFITK